MQLKHMLFTTQTDYSVASSQTSTNNPSRAQTTPRGLVLRGMDDCNRDASPDSPLLLKAIDGSDRHDRAT